jgi:hypothetical protein
MALLATHRHESQVTFEWAGCCKGEDLQVSDDAF